MIIKNVEKVEGGYNVYFEDIDMVVFAHKPEEIDNLKEKGFIKEEKPEIKKDSKKGK